MEKSAPQIDIKFTPFFAGVDQQIFRHGHSLYKQKIFKEAEVEFSALAQQQSQNLLNSITAAIYLIKTLIKQSYFVEAKDKLQSLQDLVNKNSQELTQDIKNSLEIFNILSLYRAGYYFQIIRPLKQLVDKDITNQRDLIKLQIALAKVYFNLGNHYQMLLNKFTKYVLKIMIFFEENNSVKYYKYLDMYSLAKKLQPRVVNQHLQKIDQIYQQKKIKFSNQEITYQETHKYYVQAEINRLSYEPKDRSLQMAAQLAIRLLNNQTKLDQDKRLSFLRFQYSTLLIIQEEQDESAFQAMEKQYNQLLTEYQTYFDNAKFLREVCRQVRIGLYFSKYDAFTQTVKDVIINEVLRRQKDNYPLSIHTSNEIIALADFLKDKNPAYSSMKFFQIDILEQIEEYRQVLYLEALDQFPKDYYHQSRAAKEIFELDDQYYFGNLQINDYINRADFILRQLAQDLYHGNYNCIGVHILKKLKFAAMEDSVKKGVYINENFKEEMFIQRFKIIQNSFDYMRGDDFNIFKAIGAIYKKNNNSQEYVKLIDQYIQVKLNRDQNLELASNSIYLIQDLFEMNEVNQAISMIDKIYEQLRVSSSNLATNYSDIVFGENCINIFLINNQFEKALEYSEKVLQPYKQIMQDNPNHILNKTLIIEKIKVLNYDATIKSQKSLSNSQLDQIIEDLNQIENLIGEKSPPYVERIVRLRRIIRSIQESKNKVLIAKTLGIGLILSGVVVGAIIFLNKKKN
ncbi:UNKNOWN [Stylonychia lemnae]|uniref:Uncharacterized protein n=1 Tax=Stylonychia lemnae TaxID=5949 RepID=A0A078B4U8_STYLE|nr:UNKNOWN [Stylonychia lemnae]|eukprot:CDW89555.1 UNKNOWN [Stylonychia lemnae]